MRLILQPGLILLVILLTLPGAGGDPLWPFNQLGTAEGAMWSNLQTTQSQGVERVGEYIRPRLSANSVYVAGNYAYLTDGDLHIIDVSDPTMPTEVSTYVTPTHFRDVYVAEGPSAGSEPAPSLPRGQAYAYVADGGMWSDTCGCYVDGGLRVIDVSDPATPVEVGVWPGVAGNVYLAGNYAYVAAGGLRVIDVSNPAAPVEVGAISANGHLHVAEDPSIGRTYAYVTGEGLQVVDVTDPTAPRAVGTYANDNMPSVAFTDAYSANGYAYLTAGFFLICACSTYRTPLHRGRSESTSHRSIASDTLTVFRSLVIGSTSPTTGGCILSAFMPPRPSELSYG